MCPQSTTIAAFWGWPPCRLLVMIWTHSLKQPCHVPFLELALDILMDELAVLPCGWGIGGDSPTLWFPWILMQKSSPMPPRSAFTNLWLGGTLKYNQSIVWFLFVPLLIGNDRNCLPELPVIPGSSIYCQTYDDQAVGCTFKCLLQLQVNRQDCMCMLMKKGCHSVYQSGHRHTQYICKHRAVPSLQLRREESSY